MTKESGILIIEPPHDRDQLVFNTRIRSVNANGMIIEPGIYVPAVLPRGAEGKMVKITIEVADANDK